MAKGSDLINYIQRNKLEGIEVETTWLEGLVWSVYLDDDHTEEIEYTWAYNDLDEIVYRKWYEENEDGDVNSDDRYLTEEEALAMRGLAE